MTITFRIFLSLIAIISTYIMLRKIRKSKLQIQYSIFWVNLAVLIIVIALFPNIMTVFSKILGVYAPENLVFVTMLFVLLVKTFFMTIEISDLENRLKELAQIIALQDKKENVIDNNDKGVSL